MKKKIALLHYSYPPTVGGVEFVIQAHAHLFAKDGHNIRIISGGGESKDPLIKLCLLPEIKADTPQSELVNNQLQKGLVTDDFKRLERFLYKKIEASIKGEDICIIHNIMTMHFNLPLTVALNNLIDKLKDHIKFYIWCHDSTFLNPAYEVKSPDKYPWNMLKSYNKDATYIVISEERRRQFVEIFNISPDKLKVIPNGVDLKALLNIEDNIWKMAIDKRIFKSEIVMLFPTRILARKNIELGIRITTSLKKKDLTVKFLITGQPDIHNPLTMRYYKKLLNIRKTEGVIEEVIFLYDLKAKYGKDFKIGGKELRSLYAISDLLLFPSLHEGFGIPLLEAGASRLPIASTDIPPLLEVIGRDGLTFAPGEEPDEIAEKIIKFLSRQPTYQMFRKIKERYSWDTIYKNHIKGLLKDR